MTIAAKKCFEDFATGFTVAFQVPGLSTDEIIEFAARYDPQRFHLDAEEATRTHFGGLVASGFQTQLHCFRSFCEKVLQDTHAIGAPGIDHLKWLRPWYPGEIMDVSVSLVSKRLSSKRHDRGYLGFEMRAGVGAIPAFEMDWVVIILTRSGASNALLELNQGS